MSSRVFPDRQVKPLKPETCNSPCHRKIQAGLAYARDETLKLGKG